MKTNRALTLQLYNGTRKFRRVNIVFLLSLFFIAVVLAGCVVDNGDATTVAADDSNKSVQNSFYPVMWVDGFDFWYQPAYANKTRRETLNESNSTLYLTDLGIPFISNIVDYDKLSYRLIDSSGELVEEEIISIPKTIIDQEIKQENAKFTIVPKAELILGADYQLEITVNNNGETVYYYWKLLYGSIETNQVTIKKAYEYISYELKKMNINMIGESRMWIDAIDFDETVIKFEFTGAKRIKKGFEYGEYYYEILADINTNKYETKGYHMVEKQRYYYSNEEGWILGKEITIGNIDIEYQKSETRKIIIKDDYKLIYNDKEMVLYNEKHQEMYKIFRTDKFDSDYLYDEYKNYKIEILDLNSQGEVYFAILGYQQKMGIVDEFKWNQHNGIGFYKYEDGVVNSIAYYEKSGSIKELEEYMNEVTYYNKSDKLLYIYENQTLYELDLVIGDFNYIESFVKGEWYGKQGIIVWQGSDNKYNNSVFILNMNKSVVKMTNLYQTGRNIKLIDIFDNEVVIGVYDITETYEYLNGVIDYNFHTLEVYNFDGELIKEMINEDNYFDSEIYELREDIENTYYLEESYEEYIIPTKIKEHDIIYLKDSDYHDEEEILINLKQEPKDVYKVVSDKVNYAFTFAEALEIASKGKESKIYFIDNNDGTYEEILMFDSKKLAASKRIDEVITIRQYPELPRGCEVTSLSILLDYHMEVGPGKIELADKINQSSMEYKIVDGVIHFADMHTEFAGSMSDVSQPGLGVYINPVTNLATDYIRGDGVVKGPFNLSGMSFEQMLTFVSEDYPVLVIIPNRYKPVPDYAVEVWSTPSGYMEVTYQEHSVVVMGFDDNYIYYSDPSKGRIDQKPKDDFKAAWESMGNQGMIIIE